MNTTPPELPVRPCDFVDDFDDCDAVATWAIGSMVGWRARCDEHAWAAVAEMHVGRPMTPSAFEVWRTGPEITREDAPA